MLFLFLAFPILAETWKIGDEFPIRELEDQSESLKQIPEDISKVFFTADMSASKIVNSALGEEKPEFLSENKSVLISDIHRMPGLITKFIALPKMKKYPYRLHLIRDDKMGEPFPKQKEKITFLKLKQGKITEIQFLETKEEFLKALMDK